jgi:hypothetical protein
MNELRPPIGLTIIVLGVLVWTLIILVVSICYAYADDDLGRRPRAECLQMPSCGTPGVMEVEPFSSDQIDYENRYKLHGNVTHSKQCVDANGCVYFLYVTVYDCFQSRQGAPPGYCYSSKYMGQPVFYGASEVPPTCSCRP